MLATTTSSSRSTSKCPTQGLGNGWVSQVLASQVWGPKSNPYNPHKNARLWSVRQLITVLASPITLFWSEFESWTPSWKKRKNDLHKYTMACICPFLHIHKWRKFLKCQLWWYVLGDKGGSLGQLIQSNWCAQGQWDTLSPRRWMAFLRMRLEAVFLSLHRCTYMCMHTTHMHLHEHTHAHIMHMIKNICKLSFMEMTLSSLYSLYLHFFTVASELLNIHQGKQTKRVKSKGCWILNQWQP